jgi:hypothetical protein
MASAAERRTSRTPRYRPGCGTFTEIGVAWRSLRLARGAALALLLALAVAAVTPAPASAAERLRVCKVYRAPVLSSPDGFVVGYLFRPDPVRVLRRSASRGWARIVTSDELRGWIRSRYLCRR